VLLLTVGPGCGLAPEIFVGAPSEPRGAPRSGTPAAVWRMTPAPSRLTMVALRWVPMVALRWVLTRAP